MNGTQSTPDRSMLLGFLFFIRLGAVTSYSVMFSTLSLYLVNQYELKTYIASDVVGIFVAFVYILPLIASVIGQRLLPFSSLFITGVCWQVLGALILTVNDLEWVYWGLSLFLMGSMVSSISINMLITQSYATHEVVERKSAFLWNYSGMNAGFLIGYVISGFFQLRHNYAMLFICVAIFSALSASLMLLASYRIIAKIEAQKTKILNLLATLLIMGLLVIIIHSVFKNAYLSKNLLLECSAIFFVLALTYLYCVNKQHRSILRIFFSFTLLSTVFWSIYMLTPTSLMLFVQDYVKTQYGVIKIPPQWLDIIDALVLVLFTPLLAKFFGKLKNSYNYEVKTPRMFQVGFFIYIAGIGMLLYAMHYYQAPISILWVAIYMAMQAFAEGLIGPGGYALMGDLLPEKMRSFATALWMMTLGIAGLIASSISNIAFDSILQYKHNGLGSYHQVFFFIFILGLTALLSITLMQGYLTKRRGVIT
ncbi:MAG: hypothetical protein HKM04_10975 [Legionellales bacterium]|nr:hypothetical protein [Legionellales bacterium]